MYEEVTYHLILPERNFQIGFLMDSHCLTAIVDHCGREKVRRSHEVGIRGQQVLHINSVQFYSFLAGVNFVKRKI